MDEKLKEKGKILFGILKKILDKAEQQSGERRAFDDWDTDIHAAGEKQIIVEISELDPTSNNSEIYTCCEDGTVFGTYESEGGPLDEDNPDGGNEIVIQPMEITESSLDHLIQNLTEGVEKDLFL